MMVGLLFCVQHFACSRQRSVCSNRNRCRQAWGISRHGVSPPTNIAIDLYEGTPPMTTATRKRRVMLKLSGEAFGGGSLGVNPDVVGALAREIAEAAKTVEISIVVGGGNFFRGAELSQRGMDRGRADYMGMLGTVMNALALQDFLEQAGAETRVQSAISMTQVAESYIPLRAERHMEKGRVVIFGAGAGLPYFSTDTVAAQRALEIGAEVVLVAKNGVDGVYDSDPRTNPDAKRIDRLTYLDALQRELKVVDSTAFSLCMDNKMPMVVFGMEPQGNVTKAILGDDIGTLVSTSHE
jgi:uridylate kinase